MQLMSSYWKSFQKQEREQRGNGVCKPGQSVQASHQGMCEKQVVSDWGWGLHGGRPNSGGTEMPGTKITRRCFFVCSFVCLFARELESMQYRKEK